jgi:hypothetical protein
MGIHYCELSVGFLHQPNFLSYFTTTAELTICSVSVSGERTIKRAD